MGRIPRIGPTIALTSLAIVASELTLTRLFSVVLWYHFAFFAISVALFGLGVAALGVHFFEHRLAPEATSRQLAFGAVAQAVALVVLDLALSSFSPDWFGGVFTELTPKLVGLFLLAALPFLAGGFLLGAPLPSALVRVAKHAPERIPWLWSVNGATSVLGSILATLTALHGGLRLTVLVGAVAYALALVLSLRVVPSAEAT